MCSFMLEEGEEGSVENYLNKIDDHYVREERKSG